MTSLATLKPGEEVNFNFLRRTLRLSDGNLSTHLSVLEKKGYIDINKTFVDKKPRTSYKLTKAGRKAFLAHLDFLEQIISDARSRS
ncbi:MAG TPA: transcriptional regulator [Actinobacteria bacterium]|nr:transcriptional regulator [Actinomycetes bacterium]HEX21534.1 transcriptional regulator [Actinomycetota bacterium]